jgi:CHAT domain-containing protein
MSAAELSRLPIPSHVLLSACSSSGATGAGAGEWLGLGGSLLRGGALQVIATSWPILDSAFTARFELGILKRMCADGDPAAALRQSQLDALSEWHSHTWRPSETVNAALPWIWAAFQVIG